MITRAIAACKTIRLIKICLSLRNKRSPRIRLIIPNYRLKTISLARICRSITKSSMVWHLNSGFIGTNSTICTFFNFGSRLLFHNWTNMTGIKIIGTSRYHRTFHSATYSLCITSNNFTTTIFCCVKTSGNKVAYYFSDCSLNRSINNRNLFRICLRQNLFSLRLRNIFAFGEKTKAGTRASQCKRDKSRTCWMW